MLRHFLLTPERNSGPLRSAVLGPPLAAVSEDLAPRSHGGAQHLFDVHFVKTGRFDPSTSRLVARLQKLREEADYAQAFVVDDEGAREEIEAARAFVDRIRGEIPAE